MKKAILFLTIGLVLACSTSNDEDLNTSTTEAASSQKLVSTKIPTVTIGRQKWMLENLNVAHYRNGDVIPQVESASDWNVLTTGAWCYYNNEPVNGVFYGKLYNWYAVIDPRGLAPKGFHIPTDAEWTILTDFLGGSEVAGVKMKAVSPLWNSPNIANNSSGFTALPGGQRYSNGDFILIGSYGYWYSSTEGTTFPLGRSLYYNDGSADIYNIGRSSGYSVRCLRD